MDKAPVFRIWGLRVRVPSWSIIYNFVCFNKKTKQILAHTKGCPRLRVCARKNPKPPPPKKKTAIVIVIDIVVFVVVKVLAISDNSDFSIFIFVEDHKPKLWISKYFQRVLHGKMDEVQVEIGIFGPSQGKRQN